jgi:hypothetical protein
VGLSLATAGTKPMRAGASCASSLLVPRSDDATGAEVMGQGAGVIAAVASRLVPRRSRMLDWGRGETSCTKPDAYLQTLRPPVFRR